MIVQSVLFILAVIAAYWFWRRGGRGRGVVNVIERLCSMALWIYAVLVLLSMATATKWFVAEVTPWWAALPLLYFTLMFMGGLRPRLSAHG